jgi:hypothetical protein
VDVTFSAFDAQGLSLFATTAEDRFFGVQFAGGISAISIASGAGSPQEVDHVQWGFAAPVPEPQTAALLAAGGLFLGWRLRHAKGRTPG